MTFSVCSDYRLKSILLRNDPKFLDAFDEIIDRPKSTPFSKVLLQWKSIEHRIKRDRIYYGFENKNKYLEEFSEYIMFLDRVMELDGLIKRVEKSDKLREVLAGTMLAIKISVLPALKNYHHISYAEFSCPVDEGERLETLITLFLDSVSASALESAFNVVVAAVVLLSFVYQYLIGYVDRGGSKTYSSDSLDFRDTYVAIVLFQGAHVWIKFRQAARPGASRKRKSSETQVVQFGDKSEVDGVYARPMKDKLGTITHYKYEPRLKPPRERVDSGTTLKFNCLSLGQYNTPGEAKIVRQIAAFYYGKDEGRVELEDGSYFSIPLMSEQEKCLTGTVKAKWVKRKVKEVYEDFQKEKAKLKLLNMPTKTGAHSGHGRDAGSDPSPSAVTVTCSSPGSNKSADELALYSDDCYVTLSGFEDMIYELLYPERLNIPPQQPSIPDNQMHHLGVSDILGDPSPPQIDGATQGLEFIESQLSPNLNFQQGWDVVGAVPENIVTSGSSPCLKQRDPVLGQVNYLQQLVNRQRKQLEDSVMRNVDLQHQLSESEVQNSELQRENERLKTMIQQVAKSQVATWSGIRIDFQ